MDATSFFTSKVKELGYSSIWEMPTYVLLTIRSELAAQYPGDEAVRQWEEEIAYKQRRDQILQGK